MSLAADCIKTKLHHGRLESLIQLRLWRRIRPVRLVVLGLGRDVLHNQVATKGEVNEFSKTVLVREIARQTNEGP